MKTTVKKLSDTKVEIKVVLDKKELAAAREKAIARLATEVKIPGFRKGKVPADMAEKHLNPNDIAQVSLDIAVRTAVPEAFMSNQQNPLVVPEVNVTKYVPDEEAEFTATADILPDVKIGDYKKLGVKKTEIKVTEKDVKDILDNIANAYAYLLKDEEQGRAYYQQFVEKAAEVDKPTEKLSEMIEKAKDMLDIYELREKFKARKK